MSTDAEMGGGDDVAVGRNQGALDCVLQLADVARPGVGEQELTSFVAEA